MVGLRGDEDSAHLQNGRADRQLVGARLEITCWAVSGAGKEDGGVATRLKMCEQIEHRFVGCGLDLPQRVDRPFDVGLNVRRFCAAEDQHVAAEARVRDDRAAARQRRKLSEDRNLVGASGLKMEMVRRRCAAARAVVQRGHVGADCFGQTQECVDASGELLRAVLATGDRAMERQDRIRIRQDDEVFERDAALLRRHVLRAQEAGPGSDRLRVGLGERRSPSRRVHLNDDGLAA